MITPENNCSREVKSAHVHTYICICMPGSPASISTFSSVFLFTLAILKHSRFPPPIKMHIWIVFDVHMCVRARIGISQVHR